MDRVLVLDFGGQYNQLIARRVRECNVFCEVKPHTMPLDEILAYAPAGIIFTGGPGSVYAEGSPKVDPALFDAGIPILGICYGCWRTTWAVRSSPPAMPALASTAIPKPNSIPTARCLRDWTATA